MLGDINWLHGLWYGARWAILNSIVGFSCVKTFSHPGSHSRYHGILCQYGYSRVKCKGYQVVSWILVWICSHLLAVVPSSIPYHWVSLSNCELSAYKHFENCFCLKVWQISLRAISSSFLLQGLLVVTTVNSESFFWLGIYYNAGLNVSMFCPFFFGMDWWLI